MYILIPLLLHTAKFLVTPFSVCFVAKMLKYEGQEETRIAPKGQFVVYVGEGLKRFTLPLSYLKNPKFQKLLEKAAEEYEFSYSRGIVLQCDESTFKSVIQESRLWVKAEKL